MNLVLHIPHASLFIPSDALPYPEALPRLKAELLPMTDRYTDLLFDHGLCPSVVAGVSRLISDMERFPDDAEEPMAGKGMGVVYTHGHDGKPLYPGLLPEGYRDEVMDTWYWPHHRRLETMVENALATSGSVLLLDCHSFSSRPLAYEKERNPSRPDICVGTDSFHTPMWLTAFVRDFFASRGYTVALDNPYGGALVPLGYYGKDKRVLSVMVEVKRSLYMDEEDGRRNGNFLEISSVLRELELTLLALR